MTSLLANVMLPPAADLAAFSPELVIIATAVASLLLPFFIGKSGRATATLVAAGAAAAAGLAGYRFLIGTPGPAFSGLLVADGVSAFLRVLIYGFLALVAVMWLVTASRRSSDATVGDAPEFFLLMLAAAVGMGLMVSTLNLLMLVIAIEMASLPSYAMAGFQKRQRLGAEASLKYVVFGASTAAIMIYGVSLLYGAHGTLNMAVIAEHLAVGQIGLASVVGLLGLLVGVGFKISAVPFHFWCPDVFEGASVEVATFLSVASKAAGLTLLLRLVYEVGQFRGADATELAQGIALAIGILATITASLGNLAALAQDNLKRLLAYSSIAHAGYVLMGLAILPHGGSGDANTLGTDGSAAVMIYLLVYLFMNLGAFSVVALVYNRTGREDMGVFAGLGRRAPLLAVPMVLFMLSLVGVPPLTGFFAKFQLFYAVFVYQPIDLRWLVAVGLLNTLVSLFYYMRVVKAMYLQKSEEGPLLVSRLGAGWVIALSVPVTFLWLIWGPLVAVANHFNVLFAG